MRRKDAQGHTLYPFVAICQDGENGSAKLLAIEIGFFRNDREAKQLINDPNCPAAVRPYMVLGVALRASAARRLRERARTMNLPYNPFVPDKRTHRLHRLKAECR